MRMNLADTDGRQSALPDDLDVVDPSMRAGMLIDVAETQERRHRRQKPRPFSAREALICLEFEALLVAVTASNVAQGVEVSEADRARLWLASSRITAIVEEAIG